TDPDLLTSKGGEAFDLLEQGACPGREAGGLPSAWSNGIRGHRGSWRMDLRATHEVCKLKARRRGKCLAVSALSSAMTDQRMRWEVTGRRLASVARMTAVAPSVTALPGVVLAVVAAVDAGGVGSFDALRAAGSRGPALIALATVP